MNIGVIGYGYWGKNLVRNFYNLELCNLKIVTDIQEEKLIDLKKLHPSLKVTTDLNDLIHSPEIDAVAISTPANTHYKIAKNLLEAGKHILVEKPICLSSADALELHQISKKNKLILMVSHTFLYNDSIRFIKEYISQGKLGGILYINCIRTGLGPIREDVNAMWDLAPHDISIVSYLLGRQPCAATAFGKHYIQKKVDDVVFMTIEFEHKIIATINLSWIEPVKTRQITIVGEKQMIVFDDLNVREKVKIYDKGIDYQSAKGSFGEFQLSLRDGNITIPNIKNREPLKTEVEHFVDCIQNNNKPLTDGLDAYNVVKVLEAAQRSLSNGNIKMNLTP